MHRSLFFKACSLALAITVMPALSNAKSASADAAITAKSSARSIWLVEFEEPALAAFRGDDLHAWPKLRGLEPTSPVATGARRLDVDTIASQAYRVVLADLRAERMDKAAQNVGRPLKPLFVYDVVNNGVALELTAAEASLLAKQDGIAHVEPDFVRIPMTDAGPQWIKADKLWNASGGGYQGEGRIVGIIDTGINPKHPSFGVSSSGYMIKNPRPSYLGLCASSPTAGCNEKLIGIWDFTSGDGDAEANDGLDKHGHGSHVASTAAGVPVGLSSGRNMSGVAPRANIISYKACEVESTCKGAWTLAAVNKAVEEKVDVINYSLGGGQIDPWRYQETQAMLNAFEAGVVVVVAAGNDGPLPSTVTSPSNAPWVLSIGNTTHDRGNVAWLTLTDGPSPRPGGGVLLGASASKLAHGPAPMVYAGDYGSPLCATGPNVDALPPDPSTSPWANQPFSGEIVVCDRGTYARVIKGLNVKNAGGGGMVLVNDKASSGSIVADAHELAATHLSYVDGQELKAWLSTGTGHQGRIAASAIEYRPAFADILASSSGRGPIDGDWLKPNVSAPGTNIQAAYKEDEGRNNLIATMSGTSMASPHVAGGALLLRQANPSWGPAEVMSAIQTTARASVRMPDGSSPAGALEGGAGVIDLSLAVKPGLVFPVTAAQFRAANPSSNGKPRELNLPSLADQNCLVSCSFTRRVRNLGANATWQASVQMEGGQLEVTPATFTLAKDATQVLQFTFVAAQDATYGEWQEGHVVLSKNGGGVADTRIPVVIRPSAGNLPAVINLPSTGVNVTSESGWSEVSLDGLVNLPSARFSGTDLIEPLVTTVTIAQDPTPKEVYDGLKAQDEGKRFFRLQAKQTGRMRLRVEARSSTATDIDLFVGSAGQSTELPSKSSQFCTSTTPQADEMCDLELDVSAGDHFWVLVQNWQSSSAGQDDVSVQAGLIPIDPSVKEASQRPLIATGPGSVGLRQPFKVRLAWNDPTLTPGDTRWGHLLIGATDENPTGVGHVLVKLKRAPGGQSAAVALRPDQVRTMRLSPSQAQDRLYIEVPPNATRLRATSQGDGKIQLFLARDPAPTAPGIAAAPSRSAAAASSTQTGNSADVSVSGASLTAGRWYVTPVNTGTQAANFDLVVSMEYGANRAQPGWGNWYYPQRDGSGFFLSPALDGGVWVLTWYTYMEDGSPAWYLGTTAAPTAKQGSITIDMHRHSWNGQKTHDVAVGNATLTLQSTDKAQVSWNIDGESGSQPLDRIGAGACQNLGATGKKPDGNWYTPARSGFGVEALTAPGTEAYIAYIYDGRGYARWVLADRNANATVGTSVQIPMQMLKGSCPLCTYGALDSEAVGTFTRRYSSASKGRMGISVNFPAPLQGAWNTDEDVELLTTPVSCP